MNLMQVTEDYSVSPQIFPDEINAIANLGYVTIICNRPDGEDPGQPTVAEVATACDVAGISLHHVPVSGMPISAAAVSEHRRIIDESNGPVLAYCRSGQRSAVIWQASA